MDPTSLVALISGGGGGIAVLCWVVGMLVTDRLHSNGAYRDLLQDRNDWRDIAIQLGSAAERGAGVAGELARRGQRRARDQAGP